MRLFTAEELEELRRVDEEIDADFCQSQEEIKESRRRDKVAALDKKDNRGRKIAERNAAYYEANKDKIAERNAAWRRKNREKWNAYQREYRRKKKAASGGANTGNGKHKKGS